MKKIIFLLIAAPLLFASCENKKQTEQIMKLEQEQNRLMSDAASKDSLINDFLQTFNEIEANLAEIKSREKLISSQTQSGKELSKSTRETINEDIRLINELMNENKSKVAVLDRKLRASNLKITEFEQLLANTTTQLQERDQEITTLKDQLANLNFSITQLNDTLSMIKDRNRKLDENLTSRTDELNTAYYVVGERKDLIEKNVLDKQGGFLGIGRSQKIASDVDLSNFTRVDIRNLKSIPLNVKEAKLMSVHPAGSYEWKSANKKVEELVIIDPNTFWQKSRMLVISTEK